MGEHFAQELKKLNLYRREEEGRKIIFRNGMSAEELAFELAALVEMEKGKIYSAGSLKTIVSGVIKGTRSFSGIVLEVFCRLLFVTDDEEYALYKAAATDGMDKDAIIDLEISPILLDTLEDTINQIHIARLNCNYSQAIQMGNQIYDKIETWMSKSTPYTSKLRSMAFDALFELDTVYRETTLKDEMLARVRPIIKKRQLLTTLSHDKEMRGLLEYTEAINYYNFKDHDPSLDHYRAALETVTNPNVRFWIHKLYGLALAYTNQKGLFEKNYYDFQQLLLDTNGKTAQPEFVVGAFEGIGRGFGILGAKQKTQKYINLSHFLLDNGAREYYHKVVAQFSKAPYLDVQIIGSKVEVIALTEPTDKKYLHTEGKRGRTQAQEYGCKRHYELLDEKITKLLYKGRKSWK